MRLVGALVVVSTSLAQAWAAVSKDAIACVQLWSQILASTKALESACSFAALKVSLWTWVDGVCREGQEPSQIQGPILRRHKLRSKMSGVSRRELLLRRIYGHMYHSLRACHLERVYIPRQGGIGGSILEASMAKY